MATTAAITESLEALAPDFDGRRIRLPGWSGVPEHARLLDALRADEEIGANYDSAMHVLGNGSSRHELDGLAWWLLGRTQTVGSKAAVADVFRYLREPTFEAFAVLLLTGLHIHEDHNLGHGVAIASPGTIPTDRMRRAVWNNQFDALPLPEVTAALVMPLNLPRIIGDPAEPGRHDVDTCTLEDARLCLAMCRSKGCGVQGIATTIVAADSVPIFGGTSWTLHNFKPPSLCSPLIPLEARLAEQVFDDFMALDDSDKALLRLPMSKLNNAAASLDPVDRAVGLRTALECLFLNRDEKTEMVYRLSLRVALYTEDTVAGRRVTQATIKDAYNVSSTAVHTGRLPTKGRLSKNPGRLLDFASQVVRTSVLKRLSAPAVNWEDVQFAAGAAPSVEEE